MKKTIISDRILTICYFGLYLIIGLSLLLKQPFGNPPDEYNRYLVTKYIADNNTLPNGYDEAIRIDGYGFSYAFQPILPYMLQGYAMKFINLFTDSPQALLYTARVVNLLFGLITAWIVLLLSRQWFRNRGAGWIFAFLTTFLPQSIFVHTYVNTDSCCMLSIAIMLYALTQGLKDSFSARSCIILAAGIILCALSYYNAYGYILSCILIFTAFFIHTADGKPVFHVKDFLKKGLFISALVLAGIAWWFIRSALLYDGDFLGLRSRDACAALYAVQGFRPDSRVTWQSQGFSILDMIRESNFITLSGMSFISMYGPMTIATSLWVYRFYKGLFYTGILMCVLIPGRKTSVSGPSFLMAGTSGKARPAGRRRGLEIFCHINMVFCMLMPFILSLIYSYATDYQPQGRYLLPALLPLCFYAVRGLEKLWELSLPLRDRVRLPGWTGKLLSLLFCAVIAGLLILTVYGYAFPAYDANPLSYPLY